MPPPQRNWLYIIGFVILWNSGFIGAEYALPFTQPLTLLFWRYWILAAFLFVYLLLRKRLAWPGRDAVLLALMVGVLAHAVWLGCVFYSLQYGVPSGIVALVVALQPMTTGMLSGLVAGERTSFLGWLGLLIGFAGVMIAVLARIQFSDPASIFAYLIPFGSVAAITIASLLQRRSHLRESTNRLPVDVSLFYQSVGVGLSVSLPAIFFEGLHVQWTPLFLGGLLWLILVVSLGAYALMWLLIERMDATRVATLFYFGPPVTMLMAWLAFGDALLLSDFLGMIVISLGVGLSQVAGRERNEIGS